MSQSRVIDIGSRSSGRLITMVVKAMMARYVFEPSVHEYQSDQHLSPVCFFKLLRGRQLWAFLSLTRLVFQLPASYDVLMLFVI